MSDANRREATRILSEFPLVLISDKGEPMDQNATAHDVSDKGFKAEARSEMRVGEVVRYSLSLTAGDVISGRARIVWCQRIDVSYWAGAQFLNLSRGDRKRVRRVTSPSDMDWDALGDKALVALGLLLGTLVLWTFFERPVLRAVIGRMIPQAFAAVVAGLALRELLRRR